MFALKNEDINLISGGTNNCQCSNNKSSSVENKDLCEDFCCYKGDECHGFSFLKNNGRYARGICSPKDLEEETKALFPDTTKSSFMQTRSSLNIAQNYIIS